MSNAKIIKSIANRKKANDRFYTPKKIVDIMLKMCDIKETDKVLDPCIGEGAFYNNLPKCEKYWCEIDKGKDFFEWNKKVDLMIGNPPYSMWNKWLDHTIKYCDKFCYVFGIMNLTNHRIKRLEEEGFFITKIHVCKVSYWLSNSMLVLFEKNKKPIITATKHEIKCEKCGKRCGRGQTRKGVKLSPNICYLETLKKNKKNNI